MQTFKDLRKIIDHVSIPFDGGHAQYPPTQFDEKRVVLLDDSPLKAVNQPWNQLVIPEYDRDEYYASKEAVVRLLRGEDKEDRQEGMDKTLLAVIGILEELSTVDNVPAWVRAGGLIPNVDELEKSVRRLSMDGDDKPTLEDLPSFADFQHWYTIPSVMAYWIEKAKITLQARGIQVDHGLDDHGYRRGQISAKVSPQTSRRSPKVERYPNFDRSARAWSPSRPADQSSPPQTPRFSPSSDRNRRSPSYEPFGGDGTRRYMSSDATQETSRVNTEIPASPSTSAQPSAKSSREDLRTRIPPGVRVDTWRTFRPDQASTSRVITADPVSSLALQDRDKLNTTIQYVFVESVAENEGETVGGTIRRTRRTGTKADEAIAIEAAAICENGLYRPIEQSATATQAKLSKKDRKRAAKPEREARAGQAIPRTDDLKTLKKRIRADDPDALAAMTRATAKRKKNRPDANERRAARMKVVPLLTSAETSCMDGPVARSLKSLASNTITPEMIKGYLEVLDAQFLLDHPSSDQNSQRGIMSLPRTRPDTFPHTLWAHLHMAAHKLGHRTDEKLLTRTCQEDIIRVALVMEDAMLTDIRVENSRWEAGREERDGAFGPAHGDNVRIAWVPPERYVEAHLWLLEWNSSASGSHSPLEFAALRAGPLKLPKNKAMANLPGKIWHGILIALKGEMELGPSVKKDKVSIEVIVGADTRRRAVEAALKRDEPLDVLDIAAYVDKRTRIGGGKSAAVKAGQRPQSKVKADNRAAVVVSGEGGADETAIAQQNESATSKLARKQRRQAAKAEKRSQKGARQVASVPSAPFTRPVPDISEAVSTATSTSVVSPTVATQRSGGVLHTPERHGGNDEGRRQTEVGEVEIMPKGRMIEAEIPVTIAGEVVRLRDPIRTSVPDVNGSRKDFLVEAEQTNLIQGELSPEFR